MKKRGGKRGGEKDPEEGRIEGSLSPFSYQRGRRVSSKDGSTTGRKEDKREERGFTPN